jgi:N-methylhydantoinase B
MNLSDPVLLAVLWTRLQSVVDEAATVLMRTAFSSIVRDSRDFTVVLTDPTGVGLIQTKQGVGALGPAVGVTTRAALETFPLESWSPGDVVMTNDPWIAAGHAGDVATITPLFRRNRLIGFVAVAAHVPDIGGRLAPSDAKEVYEEGIIFPPMHLMRQGKPLPQIVRLIEKNVRIPDQVMGDIFAQVSSARLCDTRLMQILDEYGLDDLADLGRIILDRSERAVRDTIAAMPDGSYSDEVITDGFSTPLTIRTTVTIKGEEMLVDFAGTSDQVAAGINSVLNYTRSYSHYTLKCLLDPSGPNNDGAMRPVTVTAPEGSLMNARYPAPVYARSQSGHYIGSLLMSALAPAAPDRVIAGCGSPSNRTVFNGRRADGKSYSFLLFTSGGLGARSTKDGLPATPFPSNTGGAPVESMERETDLVVRQKSLEADTGGDGKYRGGLGMKLAIENTNAAEVRLSIRMDRLNSGAGGLFGGGEGGKSDLLLNGKRGTIATKGASVFKPGDVLTIVTPGGGGYGPVAERDATAHAADLDAGYISNTIEENTNARG